MRIYNTLTAKEEEFFLQTGNEVNMYVCGITPYDEVHLGHGRCYVVFDVLRRYLEYKGYNVNYIQNFTDIDDKILNKSKELNLEPKEVAEKYINIYFEVEKKLNIKQAKFYPKVTEHIDDIIIFIEKLLKKDFAYISDTGVYFDITKFSEYGKLSKKKIDDLIAGARIEVDETKKNPLDFVLWKFSKPQEIFWDTPWGKGRPGWHIECSVMSMKYLGETLDIHGGGMDLIFPHHENEIAQSESLTGKKFVNYWVHNGFVTVNKQKMSKSLKNIFALNDLFEIYDPMVIRLFLISQHYQKPLDFSLQDIEQFRSVYQKFIDFSSEIENLTKDVNEIKNLNQNIKKEIDDVVKEFESSMDKNLNTSSALAKIHKLVALVYKIPKENKSDILYGYEKFKLLIETILGIKISSHCEIPQEIKDLVSKRELARKNKDYKTSDEIRKKIFDLGYILEDTPYGTKIKKKI